MLDFKFSCGFNDVNGFRNKYKNNIRNNRCFNKQIERKMELARPTFLKGLAQHLCQQVYLT